MAFVHSLLVLALGAGISLQAELRTDLPDYFTKYYLITKEDFQLNFTLGA